MNSYLLLLLLFISLFTLRAQELKKWTLQECLEYATRNSPSLIQAQLNVKAGKAAYDQSKLNLLPAFNAFANHSYNFGQVIDRYTNQFANQRVQSNNFALSSNLNIFNGLQNYYTIHQNKFNYQAALADEQKAQNDLILNIVNAYLQILFANENINAVKNQLELTRKQLSRTQKLYEAGTVNRATLLNLESQLANEELQLVNAENNYNLSLLNLALLLNLENPEKFQVSTPEINLSPDNLVSENPENIFLYAEKNLPEVQAAELKLKSAQMALSAAKGAQYPTVSFSASMATGFSGLRKDFSDPVLLGYQPFVGPDQTSLFLQPVYSYKSATVQPFRKQIKENINRNVGFNVNIPLFNGWQTQTAIKRAEVNLLSQKIGYDNVRNQLRRSVYQAYADAQAAQKKYQASLKAFQSQEENFRYAQQRFELGVINFIDFSDAKNRLIRAEIDCLQAKYDYFFKMKVLEFYQGKTISLQ